MADVPLFPYRQGSIVNYIHSDYIHLILPFIKKTLT